MFARATLALSVAREYLALGGGPPGFMRASTRLALFVAPDRKLLLRLDLDEFAALELHVREPEAYDAAIQALHELEEMARTGAPPFDRE
jgi:hypothetical protein